MAQLINSSCHRCGCCNGRMVRIAPNKGRVCIWCGGRCRCGSIVPMRSDCIRSKGHWLPCLPGGYCRQPARNNILQMCRIVLGALKRSPYRKSFGDDTPTKIVQWMLKLIRWRKRTTVEVPSGWDNIYVYYKPFYRPYAIAKPPIKPVDFWYSLKRGHYNPVALQFRFVCETCNHQMVYMSGLGNDISRYNCIRCHNQRCTDCGTPCWQNDDWACSRKNCKRKMRYLLSPIVLLSIARSNRSRIPKDLLRMIAMYSNGLVRMYYGKR
jgi:hypothetical protein